MKTIKILSALACTTIGATIAPVVASCGVKEVKVTIDDANKTVSGVKTLHDLAPTSYTATFNFKLSESLPKDDLVVVDQIMGFGDVFKVNKKASLLLSNTTLVVYIDLEAKEGVEPKIGDTSVIRLHISSKKGAIKDTEIDGLTFKLIQAPWDIDEDSLQGNWAWTKWNDGVLVEGLKVKGSNFDGLIFLGSDIVAKYTNDDGTYTLTGSKGTMGLFTGEGSNVVYTTSVTKTPESAPDFGDEAKFTVQAAQVSFVFIPNDEKILPYTSTVEIEENKLFIVKK